MAPKITLMTLLLVLNLKKKTSSNKIYLQSALLKKILITFFAVIAFTCSYAQITSTTGGGNWNNTATWIGGVIPTAGVDVIINGNVTITSSVACANLTINAGKQLTMNGGQSLTMSGNWTNNGTWNPPCCGGNSTVTMTGNGTTIGGTATTNYFNTLVIDPGAGNTINAGNSSIVIRNGNTLTLQSGIFNIGAGNAITMSEGQSASINVVNGNFSATGTINAAQQSGANFTINATSANIAQIPNIMTTGDGNWKLEIPTPGSVRINGTLTANGPSAWGWQAIGASPIWGPASTLYMDKGSNPYSAVMEWTASSGTIGVTPGYPNNVTIVSTHTSQGAGGGYPGVAWSPTGAIGLNGTLQLGDGTKLMSASFYNCTSFNCGGLIIDKSSSLISPSTGGTVTDRGNFILQGSPTGVYTNAGASVNFAGSGTIGTPQIVSTTGASITFGSMTVSNGTYVQLQDPVNTGTLAMTSGFVGTTTTNSLTVTNTASTSVTGGSATAYVDGPLSWNFSASGAGPYNFPVGDLSHNGGAYLPINLSSAASTSGTTVSATAYHQNLGGTPDATITSLCYTDYWSVSTSVPFTSGAIVSVSRPTAVAPNNSLASSSTASGTYTSIGGSPSGSTMSNAGINSISPVYLTIVVAPLNVVRVGGANAGVDASCNPTTVGSLIVGGVGGIPPYTYSIAGFNGGAFQASTTFSPLTKGAYTVTVKDATTATQTAILHVLGGLQINGNDQDISICTGASTTLTASNASNTSPTFTWFSDPGLTTSIGSGPSLSVTPPGPVGTGTTYYVQSTIYTEKLLGGDFQSGVPTGFSSAGGYDLWSGAAFGTTQGDGGDYKIGQPQDLCTCFSSSFANDAVNRLYVADGSVNHAVDKLFSLTLGTSGNPALVVGKTYKFSFKYAKPTGSAAGQLKVAVDAGGTFVVAPTTLALTDSWIVATYDIVANATSLIITFSDPANLPSDGNDIIIDDIHFLEPCLVSTSVKVTPTACCPKATLSGPTTVCADGSSTVTLNVALTGDGPFDIVYAIDGANQPVITAPAGATSTTITSLPGTHTYSLTSVADPANPTCGIVSGTVIVTASAPATPTVSVTQPTCALATGSIQVTAPTSGVEYSFDNGVTYQASATKSGLTAAASYDVRVRNTSNQCPSAVAATPINAQPVIPATPTVSITQPTCSVTTGTIDVTAPTTNVEYSFDNGSTYQATATKSVTAGATYQVKVRSTLTGACVSSATPAVINAAPTVPAVPTVSLTQPTCGTATGSIQVTAPTSNVEYSFDNGSTYQATATKSVAAGATYQVLVRSTTAGACVSTSSTAAIINVQPVTPATPAVSLTQPTCSVTTGTIDVTAPTTNVEYSFDNGSTYQATATKSVTAGATYQVKVRSTLTGACVSLATPAVINAAPTVPAVPTVSLTQPTCGTATGSIQVTAPTSNVEYSFDNGSTYQATATKSVAAGATYQVLVRSTTTGACVSTSSTAAIIDVQPVTPATPTVNITQPTCGAATGTIDVTAPATNVEYSFDNGSTYQASTTKSGLAPATYQVKVRSTLTGACVSAASTPATVNAGPTIPLAPTVNITQPTCTVATGTIQVTAPISNVEYSFDNGATYGASATSSSLSSATYQVKVRSTLTGACESITATSAIINTQPVTPATPTSTLTQPTCTVPTGTIQVTAPASGVEYSFDNGSTYQASATKSNLPAGVTYQVIVRSTVGQCVSASAASEIINAAPVIPSAPTVSLTQPTCAVSTGTIQVTAPTSNVEYSFDNGATYGASVTSTPLASATYQVLVRSTTTGACVSTTSTQAIINAQPVTPAVPTATVTQPNCTSSTGTINITAWNSAYSYSIDGGVTFVAGPNISDLTANTSYTLLAKNSIGSCVSTPSTTLTINPAPVIPTVVAGNDIQVDDFQTVTLDGSLSSAGSYSWTSGDPDAIIVSPNSAITDVVPNEVHTNFILTITDPISLCSSSDIVRVTVSPKAVEIPNAFSPNGDGIHDEFEIRNIAFFKDAVLYVYNQWGELIFKSEPGYKTFWDGTRNEKPVPIGGYTYILELNMTGFKSIAGNITIIK